MIYFSRKGRVKSFMKPMKDYSFIRGVCHNSRAGTEEYLREIGYARSIGVNSFRTWLSYKSWQRDRDGFIGNIRAFIRTAYENGITVMPIIYNGNGLDPQTLTDEWQSSVGDAYVRDLVTSLRDEPGIIMWDIMNEPSCNDYMMKCTPDERAARWERMDGFLRRACALVKSLDPDGTVTIGHTFARDLIPSAEYVDVISVHDYLESEARINKTYEDALAVAEKYNKPLINSELSCIGRANTYEQSIKAARDHRVGFYVFELMIRGYWGDIHGIFYPDGTVRDPSTVTAMMGIYRNYSPSRVKPNPNKEGKATEALARLSRAMNDSAEVFHHKKSSSDEILEAAEWIVNLLEGAEMVPMYDPPRGRLLRYREMPEEARDLDEIKDFAYSLAETLKRCCRII